MNYAYTFARLEKAGEVGREIDLFNQRSDFYERN